MAQLKKITDGRVRQLLLLGGEPLLNPEIIKFMEISRKFFPKTLVKILTNGLLLNKMPEEFWKAMSKYNIYLDISIYRPFLDIDKQFVKKINKYNINCNQKNFSELSPISTFYRFDLDLEGNQDYKERFFNCEANLAYRHHKNNGILSNSCSQLSKGKIFQCFFTAGIHHFNKKFNKDLKITKEDYLDIYKAENFDDVVKYMDTPTPFCRYCSVEHIEEMPWETSNEHDISEWVYTS